MSLSWLLFCVLLPAIIDTAWVALFRARPVGRFTITRQTEAQLGFTSSTGSFILNREARTLAYTSGKQRGVVGFDQIKGLEYRVNEEYALLAEWFFGFDGMDLLPQYHDTVDWFSIAALTTDGKRVPLFLSGQYRPREFMLGWYIELQADLLARLGLMTDVEEQGSEALRAIQSRLPEISLL